MAIAAAILIPLERFGQPSPMRLHGRSLYMTLVLVVDDAPSIRRMVQIMLEMRQYRVIVAVDGLEAWGRMLAERPDLVIMDVMMPGPSGLDICRAMRADPQLADLPVIILTAGGRAEDETAAREAGAVGFLTKPFSPSALLGMVKHLISERDDVTERECVSA